jgi:hypothetical protein
VATYMMRPGEGDLEELLLMVLWRGRPGWFLAPASGNGGSSLSGPSRTSITRIGGIELTVRVEPGNQTAFIQGSSVDLRAANVFLVDRIDERGAHVFLDNFYIEARLPVRRVPDPANIVPLLVASPDILSFLRCDTPLPRRPGPTPPWVCSRLPKP